MPTLDELMQSYGRTSNNADNGGSLDELMQNYGRKPSSLESTKQKNMLAGLGTTTAKTAKTNKIKSAQPLISNQQHQSDLNKSFDPINPIVQEALDINAKRGWNQEVNLGYKPQGIAGDIETSKIYRTLIGNPANEGFSLGEMLQAISMATPETAALTSRAGIGAVNATGKIAKPVADALKSIVKKAPTPVKKAAGIGAAVTGYETAKGASDKDYVNPISGNKTLPSQTGASLREGTGKMLENIGYTKPLRDSKLGKDIRDTGQKISEGYEVNRQPFTWSSLLDPDWYANNAASSLPSTLALIPLMFAGYKGTGAIAGKLGAGPFAKTIISSLGGAAMSRPVESSLEAANTYQQVLSETGDKDQANKAADIVFNKNLKLAGLDAAQLALAFAPSPVSKLGPAKSAVAKLVAETGTESLEEGYQQAVQQQASGADKRSIVQQILNPTADMKESMAIGGIFGAGMGGAGAINEYIANVKTETIKALPDQIMPQVQNRMNELTASGIDKATALNTVLDEAAQNPGMAKIISEIVKPEAEKIISKYSNIPMQINYMGQDIPEPNYNQPIPEISRQEETPQNNKVTPQQTKITQPTEVYSKSTGEKYNVLGQPNENVFVVTDQNGSRIIVPAGDVETRTAPKEEVAPQNTQNIEQNVQNKDIQQSEVQNINPQEMQALQNELEAGNQQAVSEQTAPVKNATESNKIVPGKVTKAKTERGTSVNSQYAVVDANDVIASHSTGLKQNKEYPQELQPRDRGRIASEDQVTRILNNLEPEFLGESPKASEGAPIVGPDMVVESGNGRIIALKRGYENNHKNMAAYKQWITNNAEKFGINAEQLNNIKNPVLVRVRQSEVNRANFVKEANEQSVAAMSATEQAMSDGKKLTSGLMSRFFPSDNGDVLAASNRGFIGDFVKEVIGPSERGRYITADGSISQEGATRIRNAVFSKAYGNIESIEKLAESTDDNIKNITNAMLITAPIFAKMKTAIESGELYPLDISGEIADAARKLSQLKEEGMPVSEYLGQQSMFGEELEPLAKDILEVFNKYNRSSKKIATILNGYVDNVISAGNPNQQSLWGSIKPPTKAEALQSALNVLEDTDGKETQATLFGNEAVRGQEIGEDNTGSAGKGTQGIKFKAAKQNVNQTETPEFKKWFGDSKVVDENGKPLVVYHGSPNDFNVFDIEKSDGMIWLASNIKYANKFTNDKSTPKELYASIKNPFNASNFRGEKTLSFWKNKLNNDGIDISKIDWDKVDFAPQYGKYYWYDLLPHAGNNYAKTGTLDAIKNAGYDGIISPSEKQEEISSGKTFVAFFPEQVKSINNQGTWNANNPDIRYKVERGAQNVYQNEFWRESNYPSGTTKGINSEGITETEQGRYVRLLEQIHGTEPGQEAYRIVPDALKDEKFSAAIKIGNEIGLKVVPFAYANPENAAFDGFITPEGEMFIDANGTFSPEAIAWHERGHWANRNAMGYGNLESLVIQRLEDTNPDGMKKLVEYYQDQYGGTYNKDDILEEFISDMFAQAFSKGEAFFTGAELEERLNGYINEVLAKVEEVNRLGAQKQEKTAAKRALPGTPEYQRMILSGIGTPVAMKAVKQQAKPPGPDTSKHIVSKLENKPLANQLSKENLGRMWGRFYGRFVDDLYKLDKFDKVVQSNGRQLSAAEKAYMLAMSSRSAAGTAKFNLEEAMTDREFNKVGVSLKKVLEKIPEGKETEFNDYLILRNSISWMQQGKQVYSKEYGVSEYVDNIAALRKKLDRTDPEDTEALSALNKEIDNQMNMIMNKLVKPRMDWYEKKIPGLKAAANDLVNWLSKFTETWLVKDNGLLTQDAWDKFRESHPYYVPFYRQLNEVEEMNAGKGIRSGYANQPYQTKRAKGSQRQIVDPIESIIEQVFRYVNASRRNEVMQTVIHQLLWQPEELAGFAEIDFDVFKNDAREAIQDYLFNEGVEGVIDRLDEVFKKQNMYSSTKPNEVTGIWFGQKITVRINDPDFFVALTSLGPPGQNFLIDTFRGITRVMKTLTTGANLFFSGRNLARDLPTSYINGKNNNPFTWAIGILDATRQIATGDRFGEDDYYELYRSMGGGMFASASASNRNVLKETKQAVMPGYWRKDKNDPVSYAYKSLSAAFEGLERLTSAIESAPRLNEFKGVLEDINNSDYAKKLEAKYASGEVTVNFSRRGEWGYTLDAFVPYLNASIQGLERFLRLFKENPKAAIAKGMLAITVPTILLYLINHDDDDWKKVSKYTKDNYFLIPAPGLTGTDGRKKFIKIAKPREWGVVFSDLLERSLQAWENKDPMAFKDYKQSWLNSFAPAYRPIFSPFYDVRANKNYTGMPIVPAYMQYLSPELQYDETTSALALEMGKMLKSSPKNIDYILRSYSGFIGQMILPAMSEGRGQGGASRTFEPIKRSFVADPLYSNDIIDEFYNIRGKLDQAQTDFKATGKRNKDYNNTQRLAFNRVATDISNINKQIRQINADKTIPYNRKEKMVEQKKAQAIRLAEKRLEIYRKATK